MTADGGSHTTWARISWRLWNTKMCSLHSSSKSIDYMMYQIRWKLTTSKCWINDIFLRKFKPLPTVQCTMYMPPPVQKIFPCHLWTVLGLFAWKLRDSRDGIKPIVLWYSVQTRPSKQCEFCDYLLIYNWSVWIVRVVRLVRVVQVVQVSRWSAFMICIQKIVFFVVCLWLSFVVCCCLSFFVVCRCREGSFDWEVTKRASQVQVHEREGGMW